MSKVVAFLFVILCAVSGAAQTQTQTPAPPNPWTVSVVHTVNFQKLVEWMKRQGNQRLAVPASPPAFVYNFATGMVIDDQGHVITRLVNLTAFDKEPIINVTSSDGVARPAKLIGIDGATGFAVLEVASLKSAAPNVALADALQAGAKVQILSTDVQQQVQTTPQGPRIVYLPAITIAQGSVGQNSIYAKARGALTIYSGSLLSRNDSSVVVTPDNRIVGIAQYAGFGRAYLFPVTFIRDTAQRVLEKRGFVPAGWLGARGDSIAQLNDEEFNRIGLANRAGVILRQVAPDSPAALSGLQPGDVILGVDGFDIGGAADLTALLAMSPEGRKVKIRAFRNHQQIEITAALGARADGGGADFIFVFEQQLEPIESQRAQLEKRKEELIQQHRKFQEAIKRAASRDAGEALNEIDYEIRMINDSLRAIESESHQVTPTKPDLTNEIIGGGFVLGPMPEQLAVTVFKVKGGLLVRSVASGSIAERIGLKAGDVIISAQDQELSSVEQLIKLLNTKNTQIILKIVRNDQPLVITYVSN
jgi:S1-C subfamily serine protease